ncbi:outer membrane beta-barrel protein [Winogradskyella vidalii]|uniref:outer membrane beta-barrel protein n=1 Tax=Winogradskyella vidalii TaxID=2615024 RepID=UPI0015CB0448|nr:outer membrane beta-barrel protein [Winogradskyella vidalii]
MKNSLKVLLCFTFLFGMLSSLAQTDFGVKGGLNYTFFKVSEGNFGNFTTTETGYYGGVFADIEIEDSFDLQVELLYIGLNDFKFLNAPIYLKYKIYDNFHILVGPSLNYFFDFFNAKLKIRADLGLAYNLTPDLDVHMKYVIGFNEISPNGVFLGVGFKL